MGINKTQKKAPDISEALKIDKINNDGYTKSHHPGKSRGSGHRNTI